MIREPRAIPEMVSARTTRRPARNSAHPMRRADTRGSVRRAGRVVGGCRAWLRCGGGGAVGSGLAESAVRSVIVVMAFERAQHGYSVSLVGDQEAVEEFAADRSDEALGDRVRRGARTGVLMILMSVAVKTSSKVAVNLASRSRMRNGSAGWRRRGP